MLRIKVNELECGVKPIGLLKKKLEADFHTIKTLITNDKIRINNRKINDDYILMNGDLITIQDNNIKFKPKKKGVKPIDLKIEIVFEDDSILVLNKPSNLAVQSGTGQDITLANHLSFLQQKKNLDFLHIIHRIDKDTTGIIICAKSPQILRDLHELLKENKFDKNYVCLVDGVPKENRGKVELFLKVRDDAIEKVIITKYKKTSEDKYSLSFYDVESSFNFKNKKYSLLNFNIKTGITHQIRVHTKYLECPIIGDIKYGNKQVNSEFFKLGLKRQFLHSKETNFKYNGKKYNLKASLPKDLKEILNKLKGKISSKNNDFKKKFVEKKYDESKKGFSKRMLDRKYQYKSKKFSKK